MSLLIQQPARLLQNVREIQALGANHSSRRRLAGNMLQANLKRAHHGWSSLANRVFKPTPVNVQLRQAAAGVRISRSTCGSRALPSFVPTSASNEPDCGKALLRGLGEPLSQPQIRTGYALRYWDEIYLDSVEHQAGAEHPDKNRPLGTKCDDS